MENLENLNSLLGQNINKKNLVTSSQNISRLKDIQEESGNNTLNSVKNVAINQIEKKQLSSKNNPIVTSSKEITSVGVKKTGSGKLQTDKLIKHIKNNSNTNSTTSSGQTNQSNNINNSNNQLKSDLFSKNKLSNFSKHEKRGVK